MGSERMPRLELTYHSNPIGLVYFAEIFQSQTWKLIYHLLFVATQRNNQRSF